jgi:hypothetical protein
VVLGLAVAWLLLRKPRLTTAFSVMTCLAILVAPISWGFYLVLTIIPGTQIAFELHRRRYPRGPTITALVLALALVPAGGDLLAFGSWLTERAGASGAGLTSVQSLMMLEPSLAIAGMGLWLVVLETSWSTQTQPAPTARDGGRLASAGRGL